MTPADVAAMSRKFAPVLERMVEIMGSSEHVRFGEALDRASTELGLVVEKGSVEEEALLKGAFRVIATGRIPGAPDA